jgi:hypothetical protein
MRFLITTIIFLLWATAYSQNDQNKIDSIQKKLDTLIQRTDDKSYTRIPRNDFESIIENKINSEVHAEMHEWQWIIGVVLTILGFLFLFYFKNRLKSEVAASVERSMEIINKKIDTQFKNKLEVFWDDLARSAIKRAVESQFLGSEIKISLEKLLNDESITLQDEMKVKVIDALVSYYFYSQDKDKTEQMIKLVKSYENGLYLTTQTYANLAIAFTISYSIYGTESDRTNALEYCDKSIKRLPDYGTAYALKLEVYIIYYVKGTEEEKVDAKKLLDNTFNTISNNDSTELPMEIIERLMTDKSRNNINFRTKYIPSLEQMYLPALNDIRKRAVADLINRYSRISRELDKRYLNLLYAVLEEGLKAHISLDGTWESTNIAISGIDSNITEVEEMIFSNASYTLIKKSARKSGFIYLIPPQQGKLNEMNLYEMENDVLTNSKECIFSSENNTLRICYSLDGHSRPSAFTSTPEDKNVLISYKFTN